MQAGDPCPTSNRRFNQCDASLQSELCSQGVDVGEFVVKMALFGLLLVLLGRLAIAEDATWPHRHQPDRHRPDRPHPPDQQRSHYSLIHHYHPYNIPSDFKFMTVSFFAWNLWKALYSLCMTTLPA